MSPVGAKGVARSNYLGAKLVSNSTDNEEGEELYVGNKQHVYVFGSQDVCEAEHTAIELNELRPRRARGNDDVANDPKRSTNFIKDHFIEKRILDGDSLASIALQYGCTISELKQANNIYNNQDFFAYGTLKIPVHKFSSLLNSTETDSKGKKPLQKYTKITNHINDPGGCRSHDSSSSKDFNGPLLTDSSLDDSDVSRDSQDHLLDASSPRTVSIGTSLNGSSEGLEDFLNHMDKDIINICNKVETKKENLDDVINTLTVKCVHPMYRLHQMEEQPKLGSVGGVTWKGVLCCFLVVAVVSPLIFLYFRFYKKS